jgi:hypothetical protein
MILPIELEDVPVLLIVPLLNTTPPTVFEVVETLEIAPDPAREILPFERTEFERTHPPMTFETPVGP